MSEQSPESKFSGKLLVGLTGNIATGKSAIMRLAAERGALTIDADHIVHDLQNNDAVLQAAIAVAFGPEVRLDDGRINRAALGQIVFQDPEAMRDLEGIVHPAVRRELVRRINESEANIIIIEAIKLLEGPLAKACHEIWVTRCSRQKQLDRLRVCRGLDTETAISRIKAQPPQEEKVAQADVVIDTNGLMIDTETQFRLAWERLPDPQSVGTKELPTLTTQPPKTAVRQEVPHPAAILAAPLETAVPKPTNRPKGLEVRRARPSDVASMLLLIRKANDGVVKMKRTDLLLALSERGYFIGQIGAEVSALMGWNIDSQVARIDQIYIHPLSAAETTGLAILEEAERSAKEHICEIIIAFLAEDAPDELLKIFTWQGFGPALVAALPSAWQEAIAESQPEKTQPLIKVLRNRRLRS
jgi:dephospho-CoA kinase